MQNRWRTWVRGLVASVVGGVAGSAAVVLADYQRIAGPGGFNVLWKVAAISALTHLVMYLQKSPLPEAE